MTALLISLLVLALGPILYRLGHRASWALPALDGFVLASVGALVLGYVLPQSVAVGGLGVLALSVAGLGLPWLFEGRAQGAPDGCGEDASKLPKRTRITTAFFTGLAVLALALHAMMDGVALAHEHQAGTTSALGLAVLIHRASVGVAVWWLARPRFGIAGAITLLGLVAAATLSGFAGEHTALETLVDGAAFAGFQAFVAGSLLHVLFHRATHNEGSDLSRPRRRAIIVAGAVAGLIVATLLPALLNNTHDHHASASAEEE